MGEPSNMTEGGIRLQALMERYSEGEKSLKVQNHKLNQNTRLFDEKQVELSNHKKANGSRRDILDQKESQAIATDQQAADLERVVLVQNETVKALFGSLTESEQGVSEKERELMDGTRTFVKEVTLRIASGLKSRNEMRSKLGKDVLLSTK
jgi:hypothetical protein